MSLDDKIKALTSLQAQVKILEASVSQEISGAPAREDLLFFFGKECSFTKKSLPFVDCLERHLKRPIVRKETWHNEENHNFWIKNGGVTNCGGVPYFYNTTTGKSVCGAPASCLKLIDWSTATAAVTAVKVENKKE